MNIPIIVESHEGQFVASLVGTPNVSAVEQTRAMAISSVKNKIQRSIESGELIFLDFDSAGLSGFAGKYKNDPTLRDICDQAYKQRDEDRGR